MVNFILHRGTRDDLAKIPIIHIQREGVSLLRKRELKGQEEEEIYNFCVVEVWARLLARVR